MRRADPSPQACLLCRGKGWTLVGVAAHPCAACQPNARPISERGGDELCSAQRRTLAIPFDGDLDDAASWGFR